VTLRQLASVIIGSEVQASVKVASLKAMIESSNDVGDDDGAELGILDGATLGVSEGATLILGSKEGNKLGIPDGFIDVVGTMLGLCVFDSFPDFPDFPLFSSFPDFASFVPGVPVAPDAKALLDCPKILSS
jgi:hypothetical protein